MSDRPSIIYMLADDMGYGDLSCFNASSKIHTRNLDALAKGGMTFHDAHASSALCTPSRYSILTGRYSWRSWLKRGVTRGYDGPLIEPGRTTVPSLLRSRGYATGCIGKWHLGWTWARSDGDPENVDFTRSIQNGPTSVGFEYFFGISASLDMPPYVYVENDRATAVPDRIIEESRGKAFWRQGPIAPDFAHQDVLPNLTRKALSWVEHSAAQGGPFFLYFPLPAPHTPILPLPEFQGKSDTNAYGDFCLQVDHVVGQVMETLDRLGLADDTIVVFASDNGFAPMAGLEELIAIGHSPSHVYRGHKADIYEGGHRIPLIVRWPARIRPGSRTGETVCLIDLLATCAEMLGEPLPDDAGEDSVSNLPLWEGRSSSGSIREATVHHSADGSFSIRKGKWKLEMCAGSGGWSYPRPGEECEGLPPIQLYDLDADVGERQNVYDRYPEVVNKLKALLTRYVEDGRSTPGARQENAGGIAWKQLWWMLSRADGRRHS